MKKRLMLTGVVGALAVGLVAFGLATNLDLNKVLERYPGAMPAAVDRLDFDALAKGTVHRQVEYLTPDELQKVKRWYAERFGISPASEMNLSVVNNCVWLTESKLVFRIVHTVTVLACAVGEGTRIAVHEEVYVVSVR
jgi:hypothetical protein